METTEILEEIKKMPDKKGRLERVNWFIAEDPKFKAPLQGNLLSAIPQFLLYLLEYKETIDTFTEARYYSQRDIQVVDRDTFLFFCWRGQKYQRKMGRMNTTIRITADMLKINFMQFTENSYRIEFSL